jgi:two-component system cell cycle response regulator
MSKAKILLVQSTQTQGNGTKHLLERAGYDVVRVSDGASAMSLDVLETVDVVLIDVALPDMEGVSLCGQFRRRHATTDIPIILLTVRDYTPMSGQAALDGPDDYVAKPCTGAELDARIIAALNTRKLRNELDRKNRLLEETLARAETAAIIDPATGLCSRRQFETMFSKEFKRAIRYKQPVSCMRIDLDCRGEGQKTDEGLVKAVITLIQKTIREVDTAAWWTGEGFIVLIPNTHRDNALQAAARILVAVADHPFSRSESKKVAMNIGVAGLPDEKIDTEAKLLEAADAALNQARQFLVLPQVRIARNGPARAGVTTESVNSSSKQQEAETAESSKQVGSTR